jgi:hypothetical protein
MYDSPIDKPLAKFLGRCVSLIRTSITLNHNPWAMIEGGLLLSSQLLAAASLRNAYQETIDLKTTADEKPPTNDVPKLPASPLASSLPEWT